MRAAPAASRPRPQRISKRSFASSIFLRQLKCPSVRASIFLSVMATMTRCAKRLVGGLHPLPPPVHCDLATGLHPCLPEMAAMVKCALLLLHLARQDCSALRAKGRGMVKRRDRMARARRERGGIVKETDKGAHIRSVLCVCRQ